VAHARLADAAEGQVVLADVEQRVVDRHAAGHHALDQAVDAAASWLKG
jgi:hypothetical protein